MESNCATNRMTLRILEEREIEARIAYYSLVKQLEDMQAKAAEVGHRLRNKWLTMTARERSGLPKPEQLVRI